MLNRRNLRIKAMQTLFAYQQCRASNQYLACGNLKQRAPVDATEPSPWWERAESLLLKHLQYNDDLPKDCPEELAAAIAVETKSYRKQNQQDLQFLRQAMVQEVEQIYNNFLWILALFPALQSFEFKRLNRKQFSDKESFKGILQDIKSLEILNKALEPHTVPNWEPFQDRLAQWYREVRAFWDAPENRDEDHQGNQDEVQTLLPIFRSVLWKSESFQNFFDERDRGWIENKDVIKSLVNKTLKSITPKAVELAPLSYQWEDDKIFFKSIFDKTLENEEWASNLVATSAKNWELDRIAQVDMILLKMALSELINFPSIPVKVTINEYIELSKKYSTPKSKKFINGILDTLAGNLIANGTIKKSGRGLIDNK